MKAKALLLFLARGSFRPKITVVVSLCLLLLAGDLLGPFQAEGGNRGPGANVKAFQSQPVTPGVFHGDLRDLPKVKGWQPGAPIREVPRIVPQPPWRSAPPAMSVQSRPSQLDPLLHLQEAVATRAFEPPDLNFDGIPNTGARPPDTVGEVGRNHYIQMVNDWFGSGSSLAIYDKTGTLIAGPVSLQTLWTAGGPCATGDGDPIVLYDRQAERWLMSEFADRNLGNHLCVYVSQTGDPVSGGWFLYDFETPNQPDYPKYAVWPDAYYVSTNEWPGGSPVYALDRSQMLLGNSATFQRFEAPDMDGFGFQALIPSDLDGPTPPPAGSPNFFMRHRDDEVHNARSNNPTQDFLEIWEFSVDFVTPANSTFTQVANIPVAEFDSDLCGLYSFECFPQPGTAVGLDPLREVIMWRLQYRNFGTYETLVGNFVSDVDGTDHGGIRWFELRKTGSGAWSLFQEGTHAPDSDHRWMGSIAMDGAGNIALGYSVSSDTTFPSIRYSGRRAADPSGTLPLGEVTLVAGGGSQTAATRWGDYSSMNVDPADDCTFWYTNEYIPDDTGFWRTRIGVFSFDDCLRGGDVVSRIVLGLAGPEGQGWMEVVEKDSPYRNITWLRVPWSAYNDAVGGTHPVLCNLDNDPEDEVVIGLDAYPDAGGWIEIKDDRNTNYAHLDWIRVPWSDYNAANGATFPACGDFDGDGRDEIAVGLDSFPAQGGWVEIKDDGIANYAHLDWIRVPRADYNAANGATYPTAGDFDGDGRDEIAIGLGTYQDAGGWIEIKDDGIASYAHLDWVRVPWTDYNAANGATFPAAGDFDGDGRDEIAIGLGTYPAQGGWVEIKDDGNNGYAHLDWTRVPWADYNAANGATFPAAGDFDGDGRDEIAVGLGTYPDAGGWFEVKDDLNAGLGHLSWGRLHWSAYNSTNGETRPGLER